MSKKLLTLCSVYEGNRILLGLKKRGFGEGRWNGFGGKVEPGETIEEAALRELKEEIGIEPNGMAKRGVLRFVYQHTDTTMDVHIFSVSGFDGDPQETEEVRPQWFDTDSIPFDSMWPNDRLWIPLLLAGKSFEGELIFSDYDTIVKYSLNEIM